MVENVSEEMPAASPVRRPWVRSLVLGVVILVCGAAIGSTVTAVTLERRPSRGSRRDHLPEQIAKEMQRKYGLTNEQEQQLLVIFSDHEKKLSEIRAEVQPRMEAEHEALRAAVEAVLTPDQAAAWSKEFERVRRPWHGRGEGPQRHRRGGGPLNAADRP